MTDTRASATTVEPSGRVIGMSFMGGVIGRSEMWAEAKSRTKGFSRSPCPVRGRNRSCGRLPHTPSIHPCRRCNGRDDTAAGRDRGRTGATSRLGPDRPVFGRIIFFKPVVRGRRSAVRWRPHTFAVMNPDDHHRKQSPAIMTTFEPPDPAALRPGYRSGPKGKRDESMPHRNSAFGGRLDSLPKIILISDGASGVYFNRGWREYTGTTSAECLVTPAPSPRLSVPHRLRHPPASP